MERSELAVFTLSACDRKEEEGYDEEGYRDVLSDISAISDISATADDTQAQAILFSLC
jgi:hypothetical protein